MQQERRALLRKISKDKIIGEIAAVASIKAGTKGIEVKLYDKLRALELLGKIYGVFGGDISEEEAVENLKKFFGEDGFGTD